ncbi:MAG: hypothetical protein V1780_02730 [Chloroflexota bacterium]
MPTSSPLSRSRQKNPASDRATVRLGYPAFCHWTVLLILLGLLVLSAFKQMVPLLASTVLLLVLALLPRFWSRYALRGLTGKISTSRDRVFPGETVELTFELANQGIPLPLAGNRGRDTLSPGHR